mgnify:CR=1 FL=1
MRHVTTSGRGQSGADDNDVAALGAQWDAIRLSTVGDVLVVEPRGDLDSDTLGALDRVLTQVDAPAVLDLRHCDRAAAAALSDHDPSGWGRSTDSVCVVIGRESRPSIAAREPRLSVFGQPADAIQARILAQSGFGAGWS